MDVKKMGRNWKTTLGALVVIFSQALAIAGIELDASIQAAIVTIGIAMIGIFSKDSDVTGGNKQNAS